MKKKENRVIPWQIKSFAISNITSHPSNHSSNEACSSYIMRERKKFAYKIMDLFESLNKPNEINILERVGFLKNEISDLMDEYFKQNRIPLV